MTDLAAPQRQVPPADRLPTLTEVVQLGPEASEAWTPDAAQAPDENPFDLCADPASGPSLDFSEELAPTAEQAPEPVPAALTWDDASLSAKVMADLQPELDALLDDRLREVLASALERAAEGMLHDCRQAMQMLLRDAVSQAVQHTLEQARLPQTGHDSVGGAGR